MLIIAKNLFGEIIGNLIYIYLIKNNNIMNGIGMIINFSWVLFGVLGFTLLFEFNLLILLLYNRLALNNI